MTNDSDYFAQFASNDLPTPVDASAPGVFRFDALTVFALGNDRYVVNLSKNLADAFVAMGEYRGLLDYLSHTLGDKFILVQGDTATYTPLEQSADLKTLIRQIVQNELAGLVGTRVKNF